MAGTVLAVSTRALLDTCDRLGLDGGAIARRAGLDRGAIDDPDARVPTPIAEAVWREALASAGDPALALHAAEAVPDGAYRVLDYAAAASATLGDALRRVASYLEIVGQLSLEIEEANDSIALVLSSAVPGVPLAPPAQEYTLAAVLLRTRRGCGVPWVPLRVTLTFDAPADATEHARVFGVAPEFAADRAAMLVSREDWERPSSRADAGLASVLDQHARDVLARLPSRESFAARVAEEIAPALRGGDPSLAAIARALAMTERTLQRRLEDEGTSFVALVASERERAARAYLERSDVAIAEVAWLLGFSDQSAFTRAFRRWTGQTPARYRARALRSS